MRWLDEADRSIERAREHGVELQVITRDEWIAMPPAERQSTGPTGGKVVRDVAYRGDGAASWLMCSRRSFDSDAWVLWDMRTGKAEVLLGPIPDRALALALGDLAASSKVARVLLGSVMVLAAAAMAEAEVWRRERQRKA